MPSPTAFPAFLPAAPLRLHGRPATATAAVTVTVPLLPAVRPCALPRRRATLLNATTATLASLPTLPTLPALPAALPAAVAATTTPLLLFTLLAAATLGLTLSSTRVGKALSPPVVTTLTTLLLTNLTPLPSAHPLYAQISAHLVPLAVPLLLFSADLRRVLSTVASLVRVFLLGAAATLLGTLVAWRFVPIHRVLGRPDAWKIAAALCARHIGGAVNYVAVANATNAGPEAVTAALAADNVIVALYFILLLLLARNVSQPPPVHRHTSTVPAASASASASLDHSPPPPPTVPDDDEVSPALASLTIQDAAVALSVSAAMVAVAVFIDALLPFPLGPIPVVTFIALLAATLFPAFFDRYRVPAAALGVFFMQVFFAATGCEGNVASVIAKAPMMFLFSCVQLAVHLAVFLGLGKIFRFHKAEVLVASNANVGGPTTAAGMAAAKEWDRLIIPAVLIGVLGYSLATFVSLALGHLVLKPALLVPMAKLPGMG